MTKRKLKYVVGLMLVGSHVVLILFAMVLYFLNGFDLDEFTTVLAVLAPVFAGYTTSIFSFIIADAQTVEDRSPHVTNAYSAISIVAPLLLAAVIGLTICLKAYNLVFADFEEFKRFFLLIESLFSVYVGMFIYSLFEKRASVEALNSTPRNRTH